MKTVLKYLLLISTLVLYNCTDPSSTAKTVWDTIPQNSTSVVKTENFNNFLAALKQDNSQESIATNGIAEILKSENLLQYFNPSDETLIAITSKGDFSIHTKWADSLLKIDSLPNRLIETLKIEKFEFQKITVDDAILFSAIKDSIYILSSSQQHLTTLMRNSINIQPALNSINKAVVDSTAIFTKHIKNNPLNDSLSFGSYWEGYAYTTDNDLFSAHGILKSNDTLPYFIDSFKNQNPQPITIPQVLPVTIDGATIISFSDSVQLLKSSEKVSIAQSTFFETLQEFASGTVGTDSFVVAKSLDASLSLESIEMYLTENVDYRGVMLYTIQEDGDFINNKVSVLNISEELNTLFRFENYLIATSSVTAAEDYIRALQASIVLAKDQNYIALQNVLSNAATIVYIGRNNISNDILVTTFEPNRNNNTNRKGLLTVKQLIVEKDYANVALASIKEQKSNAPQIPVSQISEIDIPNTILGKAIFLNNTSSKKTNIITQDIENTLYAFSDNGTKVWSRNFDNPVLGEITVIDLNKNRKQQLAFTTKDGFYVIDNRGKDVAPFPIRFKDEVTQPLSVFDYDGNRKYRFLVVQGKEVLMYDKKAKTVKGFTFKKTKNTIASSPKHLRLGSKDYILITEDTGKINFLSRTGKSRISVSDKFDISEDGIHKQGTQFAFITKKNEQVTISQSGKIQRKKLDGAGQFRLDTENNLIVLLNDNILNIDGKIIELPFGIYTAPHIHTSNKNTYITVTETQENQVYVYDSTGRLLEGFPVYGTTPAVLYRTTAKKLQLLTLGNDKQLLLYQIN